MRTPLALCVLVAAFVIFAETSGQKTGNQKETIAAMEKMTEAGSETETVQAETETEDPLKDYPESLVSFMKKYPEAEQFVLDYPKYKDVHTKIDITQDVKKGELPLFLQWDTRWGYETYGSDFLAVTGCGPTCLAMVQCGLSGETKWNPYEVARMAQEEGYYVSGEGSSWELMRSGAEKIGLEFHEMVLDAEFIIDTLRSGMPVICSVRPGDFTVEGHFIVLAKADEDGNITVLDPNSRKNSERLWNIKELMPQIKGMWGYSLKETTEKEAFHESDTGEEENRE